MINKVCDVEILDEEEVQLLITNVSLNLNFQSFTVIVKHIMTQ